MTGGGVFFALFAYLNWLFWVTPNPGLAGMFLAGSAIFLLCSVAWFRDALRRSRR